MRVAAFGASLVLKEVETMTLNRKDVAATALTALVVLVFFTTHEGWSVWLIGGSHRWAAGAIVLAVLALVTGSLTPLSFLVVDIVLLWAVSTARHVGHDAEKPVPA